MDDFVTFFVAGQETTANTVSFLMRECQSKEIKEKLTQEIDNVIGEKMFIEFEDLMSLEYTTMAMKEALRLYPPVALTFRYPRIVILHSQLE